MASIHDIPEPTTGYHPVVDEPTPTPPGVNPLARRPDCEGQQDTSRPATEVDAELGSLTWLVMITLCGVLLRGLLLYFGLLGLENDAAAAWAATGNALFEHGPSAIEGQLPLYPMMLAGLDAVGVPFGALAVLQAILGVLAIPAAYSVGRALTGRIAVGLGAAALMALHPGVLAWTTAAAPGGLGCSLVMIGLYLLLKQDKDEAVNAWPAGVVFAFAALTAPAAWLIGLGAACACIAQGQVRGRVTSAAIVLALSVGPLVIWSTAFGQGLTQHLTAAREVQTLPHLATLADQSIRELGVQMRFEMEPNGILTRIAEGRANPPADHDPVADWLGDGWVALNAMLLIAAATSLGLLIVRQRFAAAAMLAIPWLVLLASGMPLSEPHRIALFGPLAILTFGALSTHRLAHITPAEREAMLQDKELARQQKLDAKHTKREAKHGLYAFDKPGKAKAKAKPKAKTEKAPSPAPPAEAGHALAGAGETAEPAMSRPI